MGRLDQLYRQASIMNDLKWTVLDSASHAQNQQPLQLCHILFCFLGHTLEDLVPVSNDNLIPVSRG